MIKSISPCPRARNLPGGNHIITIDAKTNLRARPLRAATTVALASLLLVIFGIAQPAAADANGVLDVRAASVACGFTNLPTDPTACADDPANWYPSETANYQAIMTGTGTPTACPANITTPALNLGTPSVAVGALTCNGRTHSTSDLLASVFTGTDADGHPDLPTAPAATCTVSAPLLTDVVAPTCGVGTTTRATSEWYIMEGFLFLPAVPSGQITVRASNLDSSGTARAEYIAFMASPDETFANLEFVGEAQTAFLTSTGLDFPVTVDPTSSDSCYNETRAVRLYMHDNIEGSSASLQWDIGNGFETIPAAYFGNNAAQSSACAVPAAVNSPAAQPQPRELAATGGPDLTVFGGLSVLLLVAGVALAAGTRRSRQR